MDKVLFILFPAITFAVVAFGAVIFELANYIKSFI
ncbi:MAG: hypothetical protein ACD_20C00402G0011 [uncultured bacterium]|nr:MAG: hypothetical protein ACD_20C00402G0011 [uncultured bacterium]